MKNAKVRVKQPRDFNFKYHVAGRIWTAAALILFLSIPIAVGVQYKVLPDWSVFGTSAVLIPLIVNFLSGVAEPIIYAPMLGTNGEYLAFITGNLSNLKIPCVVKAHEIYDTKMGTEEHEIVSTIAVAASTLVTVVIIAIFVLALALSNLSTAIKENSWLQDAFATVVYALFGSMGGKYVAKNPKLSLIPAAAIVALSLILGFTGVGGGIGSAYLFIGIGVCALFAFAQFKLEKRKQKAKEEEAHLQEIAVTEHTLDNPEDEQIDALDEVASDVTEEVADNAVDDVVDEIIEDIVE